MLRPSLVIASLVAGIGALSACDETPEDFVLGSMEITASAPAAAAEHTTADGWTLKFDRALVNLTALNVAGDDLVLAASTYPQILDLVAPGPQTLLSATLRTARAWQDVNFQIGPAAPETDTTHLDPVTDEDQSAMETGGISLHVEGTLKKGDVTKAFKWDLTTDTIYSACETNTGGVVVRGLVVPKDGKGAADIEMDPTVLFAEDLAGAGALRADEIAAADADNDGTITFAELAAAPLAGPRAELLAAAGGGPLADLGVFVAALAPAIVKTFNGTGACTAAPAAAAE